MNRETVTICLLSIFAIILLGTLATSTPFIEPSSQSPEAPSEETTEPVDRGEGGGFGNSRSLPNLVPLLTLAGMGIFLVGIGFVIYRLRNHSPDRLVDAQSHSETESRSAKRELQEVADIAGKTATRIQQTENVENEVYQAWYEMTQRITVPNRQSTTPAEFADYAISLGMNEEDVNDLTQLFQESRYGHRNPTGEDEQYAINLFQRIETTYSDENA